jgi:hypothetical protein
LLSRFQLGFRFLCDRGRFGQRWFGQRWFGNGFRFWKRRFLSRLRFRYGGVDYGASRFG